MAIKWLCSECSTINMSVSDTTLICEVCGTVGRPSDICEPRSRSAARSRASRSPSSPIVVSTSEREAADRDLVTRRYEGSSLVSKLKAWLGLNKKVVGWEFSTSDDSSSEAYVQAIPVYETVEVTSGAVASGRETRDRETRDREIRDRYTSESATRRGHSSDSTTSDRDDSELRRFDSPWETDSGAFDVDLIRSAGFVGLVREEKSGVKGYKLISETSGSRFISSGNLRTLGYLKRELSRPISRTEPVARDATRHRIDTGLWPEHRFSLNRDTLIANGFDGFEKFKKGDIKGYNLHKAASDQTIFVTIQKLKMLKIVN